MNKSTQVKESRYAEKITVGEKIAYGGGDLASNLIWSSHPPLLHFSTQTHWD